MVIPAHNEGDHLERTVRAFQRTLPASSEIVVVDDGSSDGSAGFIGGGDDRLRLIRTERIGAARARNHGARLACGAVLIFADAHLDLPPGWHAPLLEALDDRRVGAAGPAISVLGQPERIGFGMRVTGPNLGVAWLEARGRSPYPVPILGGAFLAMRREVFQESGGFDPGLIRWGGNDLELSLRLWLLGYELRVVPQAEVAHLFRTRHPYPVGWTAVLHNLLRVAFVHFNPERIKRVLAVFQPHRDLAAAVAMNVESDVWSRRAALSGQRRRDDNWFFDSFAMAC